MTGILIAAALLFLLGASFWMMPPWPGDSGPPETHKRFRAGLCCMLASAILTIVWNVCPP